MIIDISVIEGLKEIGDKEFVTELIEMFLQQSEDIMSEIRNYSENKDVDNLSKLSHKLKGSCLNLGAIDMSKVCQTIEHNTRENNIDSIEQHLDSLENIYRETCEELRRLN